MKFVVFDDDRRLGAVTGEWILDLEKAAGDEAGQVGSAMFRSLLDLIEAGDEGLHRAHAMIELYGGSGRPDLLRPFADVQLHAPFPGRRLAMAGSNFAQHVADAHRNFGKPRSVEEVLATSRQADAGGYWVISPPAGPGASIAMPSRADGINGLFDFEGELAVVLAKGGKALSAQDWDRQIWGSVLLIDWSLRRHDIFRNQRAFYGHKVFDDSKSIGPWISVGEINPHDCELETWVNGTLRQRFNSRDMMHSFGEMLEQVSRDFTFLAGDVLSSGTGAGTAADSSVPGPDGRLPLDLFLKPGDVVEVKSAGLGSLKATIAKNNGN